MRAFQGRSLPYRIFVWYVLTATMSAIAPGIWVLPRAAVAEAFVSIEHEPVGTRIVGTDITFVVKTSGSVDTVTLNLRKLADLGDFTQFQLEPGDAPGTWTFTLPLSQEPVKSRIEYFFEAYSKGEKVAVTQNYYIRFIERPYVGDPQVVTTAKLSKDEWKVLLRGGKRPLWQKWWVWAIAGVVVAGAVAASAGGKGKTVVPLTAKATATFETSAGTFTLQGGESSKVVVGSFGSTAKATIRVAPEGGTGPYTVTITPGHGLDPSSCTGDEIEAAGFCEREYTYQFNTNDDYLTHPIKIQVADSDSGTDPIEVTITPDFRVS